MAITHSIYMKQASGHINREVVFKRYGDKTVMAKYPDMSKRKLSEKQLHVNETLADANYRAKGIMANEIMRNEALLRLNVTRNKLYTALIKEHFRIAKESKTED